MKNFIKARIVPFFGIIALVAVIVFGMVSCGGDDPPPVLPISSDPDLTGTITISPATAVVGTELTAAYSGTETPIKYQWKRGSTNVGTDSNKYTPAQAGSHTVTVSAAGFKSKTSAAVTVTAGGNPNPGPGLTWTQVTEANTGFTSGNIYSITFADGKFVAGGRDRLVSSTDGITWTSIGTISSSADTPALNSVYYGGPAGSEQFIAVGEGGVIAYITFPSTVTQAGTSPFGASNNAVYGIAYGAGKYVAVGNGKIRTTTAPLSASTTWTTVDSSVFSIGNKISSIAWGNGKFVIVFEGVGNGKTATSTDGATWTEGGQAGVGSLTAVIWDGTRFVTGSRSGIVYTSADGVTWAEKGSITGTGGSARTVNDIAFGSGTYIAVADGGTVSQSADTSSWTRQTVGGSAIYTYYGAAFGANRFVVVGSSQRIYYSNTLE